MDGGQARFGAVDGERSLPFDFGLPEDACAKFAYERACRSFVCMHGDLLIGIMRYDDGGVRATVTTYRNVAPSPLMERIGATDTVLEAAFSVTVDARSVTDFKRTFQEMVALDHDGTPDQREANWGAAARWLAMATWVIDGRRV